jgi:diaminopimelate epimerase
LNQYALNYGYLIENHKEFPNRTNVEFAYVEDKGKIKLYVWERQVTKMHALGNIYIIIEDLDSKLENLYRKIAMILSDKNFGIGSDGMLVLNKGKLAKYKMRIFNPDGSEAEMCGNGIRMFAKYLLDKNYAGNEAEIEVGSRVVKTFVEGNMVSVNMGKVEIIGEAEIEVGLTKFKGIKASIGNPHFIIFSNEKDKLKQYALNYGYLIENHKEFPNRTNVEFAYVEDKRKIKLYVWERGAGMTLACGSGACATAFVANYYGYVAKEVEVELPGGTLFINITDEGVIMKGPVAYILRGEAYLDVVGD